MLQSPVTVTVTVNAPAALAAGPAPAVPGRHGPETAASHGTESSEHELEPAPAGR